MAEVDHRIEDVSNAAPADPEGAFKSLQEEKAASSNQNARAEGTSFQIPEKFKGKSLEDVVKSYVELENQAGRQGQELGDLRKLADDFIQSRPDTRTTAPEPQNPRIDFDSLAEPEKIKAVLDQELTPLRKELVELKREKMSTKLANSHPDYMEHIKNPDFAKWVAQSNLRKEMFFRADRQFDYAAADELFTSWKLASGHQRAAAESDQSASQSAFTAGSMETGRVEHESSKKVYRRADIIALKINNPNRYAQLEPEIRQAYAEGRVR